MEKNLKYYENPIKIVSDFQEKINVIIPSF
jgi:hypothetical protein